MEKEIWKDVVGYEGRYKVSSWGRVLTFSKFRRKGASDYLKQKLEKYGYLRVNLYSQGKQKTKYVHRLVCEAFLAGPHSLLVNHKNGNKKDNRLCNLELVTPRENIEHALSNGLATKGKRLSLLERERIVVLAKGMSIKQIEELSSSLGVSMQTIKRLVGKFAPRGH